MGISLCAEDCSVSLGLCETSLVPGSSLSSFQGFSLSLRAAGLPCLPLADF